MDTLIDAIFLLCHWRLVLSLAASIAAGLVLSSVFLWFTAGYCVALAILGAALGIVWQVRGEARVTLTGERRNRDKPHFFTTLLRSTPENRQK